MRKILIFLLVFIVGINSVSFAFSNSSNENDFSVQSIEKTKEYFRQNIKYQDNLMNYSHYGNYLNWDKLRYYDNNKMILDDNGLPKVKYKDEYFYNPVTLSQYALSMFSRYVEGEGEEVYSNFLKAAYKLVDVQKENGSFLYNFEYDHHLMKLEPGWVSGMAQGHALSVFSRAYMLTEDEKFLIAGNKALTFLTTPITEGGVLATLGEVDEKYEDLIIFEEYVTNPKSYTLNGFMFSLLGLYDWSRLDARTSDRAKYYFNRGIESLNEILHLYDVGGITSYDLSHITSSNTIPPFIIPFYHAVHIYQLHALYTVTGERSLKHYGDLFKQYVESAPTMIESVQIDNG